MAVASFVLFGMQVAGPFLGAFVIQRSGFRGALVVWAIPFAVVALWMGHRLGCNSLPCLPCGRDSHVDTKSKKQYAPLANDETNSGE